MKIPDLNNFATRVVAQSTKIYDRTGTILLYDVNTDTKRTVVPLSEISPNLQKTTIAIEDSDFYSHFGVRPVAILRATIDNVLSGKASQGGSTITQQIVKNSLLTQDKTIARKIKELVLAIKLEKAMTKDQILEAYFNEISYGGTVYGAEEASQAFFGKPVIEVSLAEAAYMAAIPQAPTYYSPYGTHREELNNRQRLVLQRMKDLGVISEADYSTAIKEKVTFLSKNNAGIRAPHFVMMVKDYLVQKYGEEAVSQNGLKVITTLDYDMQQKMEQVIAKFSPSLAENFNASNTAMVAIDPKTGDILAMVGSKDYFDSSIDGNYNVTLAKRQPGSTFKPFVYATAFKKGYTPDTVLFDVNTEFSSQCTPEGKPKNPSDDPTKICYSPEDYDSKWNGPITMKYALAQSRNIPAIKALYLAGIPDSLQTAHDMGITTLNDPNRYGLTLVLGGGEVTLLDLTSAYGVFANDGIRNPTRSVLKVDDTKGTTLEESTISPTRVIQAEIARQINNILSDEKIRMSGLDSVTKNIGRPVTMKTGTTNDWKDVWVLGYTPSIVVGAWAGNNDNKPMQHKVAGLVITPLWGALMSQVAKNYPLENFPPPPPPITDNKPVLHGVWWGGISYWKDKISGKVATENTPPELKQEVVFNSVHSILNWVDKDNPQSSSTPINLNQDSQYDNWEYGVRNWFKEYQILHPDFKEVTGNIVIPTETDDVHISEKAPKISIVSPANNYALDPQIALAVKIKIDGAYPAQKTEIYLNGKYVLTATSDPLNFSFVPKDIGNLNDENNSLSIIVSDSVLNKGQAILNFSIKK